MASLLHKVKSIVSPNSGEEDRGRSSSHSRSGEHTPVHHSHLNPSHADTPRSQSRGRAPLLGTGRGGAGNMSRSRVRDGAEPTETPAELDAARSRSRSRIRAQHHGEDFPVASGRGGLGNVLAQNGEKAGSREREQKIEEEDREIEKTFEQKHAHDKFLGGRGGAGNVGQQ